MATSHSLEQALIACPNKTHQQQQQQQQQEKKPRPHQDQALRCPRCDSSNTKFCYYNNYSLSQPRFFCKGCRRYWTQGGSLRNVPVGGGCRKSKKKPSSSSSPSSLSSPCSSSSTSPSSSSSSLPSKNLSITPLLSNLIHAPFSYDPSDLTLAFAGSDQHGHDHSLLLGAAGPNPSPNPCPGGPTSGFFDILRGGFLGSENFAHGFHMPCYGLDNNNNNNNNTNNNVGGSSGGSEVVVLPFEERHGGGAVVTHEVEGSSCKDMDKGVEVGINGAMNLDLGRDYWGINGVAASTWHGLINSSLI